MLNALLCHPRRRVSAHAHLPRELRCAGVVLHCLQPGEPIPLLLLLLLALALALPWSWSWLHREWDIRIGGACGAVWD